MTSENVLRLRGLPWSATKSDIVSFFHPVPISGGEAGVEIVLYNNGRPSGEAFVELENPADDYEEALKRNHANLGARYIEVFPVLESELPNKRNQGEQNGNADDCIMRLRGLPFTCTKQEIEDFFQGYGIESIVLPSDQQGRPSGEAFVQFVDSDTAERSLDMDKEKIGHRYVEVFKSSQLELRHANSREPRGYGGGPMRGGGGGGGFGSRPSPYDSGDRYGGPNRYGARGGGGGGASRNESYDSSGPYGYSGNYGDGWGGRRSGASERGGQGQQGGQRNGGGRGGNHCVHMRGIPFRATFDDVVDFFRPQVPVNVVFSEDHSGRPSGEADVEFSCHDDAVRGMSKDKMNMQHRYIELFLNSSEDGGFQQSNGGNYGRRY